MSYCLSPDCLTFNPTNHQFCQKCGKSLLLKERYQALKLIGQGGFGKTFLAIDHDKPSKPRCVIKQFFPQLDGSGGMAKAEELFAAEAQRLEELGHHDQIPALLAYFTVEGRQYLVQEYIEGENLDEELKRPGTFNEAKIRQVLLDLLPVLDFIHQRQVIHRDIKPENIIRRASDQKLVLVDFGAAKQITPANRSVTGTVIGTAEYVAPEQLNGKAVAASDLYSLGVTCLYLLTDISPFQLFDSGEFEWVWRNYLVDNLVGSELGSLLDKLVVPGTKKRYKTVEEVKQILGFADFLSPQNLVIKSEYIPDNFIEFLPGGVELEMIRISAGKFMMGSHESEKEKPIHRVGLQEFYLSKYPITQAQYQAVMVKNPSYFNNKYNNPVEYIFKSEIDDFCQQISKILAKTYRLPTEAEWEYACRAGTNTIYYFGSNNTDLDKYSWYEKNSNKTTHPVGKKQPNNWGLYDMYGNIWECCADIFNSNYAEKPEQLKQNGNIAWKHMQKMIPPQSNFRVVRGGSYLSPSVHCRSTYRSLDSRMAKAPTIGFRVALCALKSF